MMRVIALAMLLSTTPVVAAPVGPAEIVDQAGGWEWLMCYKWRNKSCKRY